MLSSNDTVRVPVSRPPIPKPTATSEEIRAYIIQFILSQDARIDLEAVEEKANKLPADGEAFYRLSEVELRLELGNIGGEIYRTRQESDYGYDGGLWPQIKVVGALGSVLVGLQGGWQVWREKSQRDYTFSFVVGGILAVLIIIHAFCKKPSIVRSKWCPETLKIRNESAATGALEIWRSQL